MTRWPLLAVFLLATAVRLAFLFGADQPLLYTHQYTYFTNGLRIAEQANPLMYVLQSDEWRTWDQSWTIAPLYFIFLGALFSLFGPHLLPVQLVQCLLGGATAAGVASLGRQADARFGVWAGVIYALYWPSIEIAGATMTENLHTPLFIAGMLLLLRTPGEPFAAGAVLGFAALARSVSTGYLGLAAVYYLLRERRRGLKPAALLLVGGAAIVLPWTARNFLIVGDRVLIESAAFENLWYANALVDRARFERQLAILREQPTPAQRRDVAAHFAWRGIRRNPAGFADKIRTNFWHFIRPEGLHNLLRIEQSQPAWRHLASLLLDDALLFAALPLFVVFIVAGRPSPARTAMLLWIGYYLFMLVVVFHNEIRYRSGFVPFLFAGALAGLGALRDAQPSVRARLAFAAGLVLIGVELRPFVAPAWRATTSTLALAPALRAADEGRVAEAVAATESAATRAPRSSRPWTMLARRLTFGGHHEAALAAVDRAAKLSTPANWIPRLVRPRLLQELARPEAAEALATAHALSWGNDPWLALETAWRELPPPTTDVLLVGHDDYGAVRGFLYPRGGAPEIDAHRLEWNRYEQLGFVLPPPGTHRWSRHRAWIRLRPATTAARYTVAIAMGYAFPAAREAGRVEVRGGGTSHAFDVGRDIREYAFEMAPDADGVVRLRLDAPAWNRSGEPAEQAVRVDRVSVTPRP